MESVAAKRFDGVPRRIDAPQPMVPFNRPYVVGTEFSAMQEAIATGHISGDGAFTKRCQALLRRLTGTDQALLTTSCTHALEMAGLLLDVGPGDEVIVPSFTFVSTVNAIVLRGATPRFVDIRPDTFNVDEELVIDAITPRTRAIVVVHYAGVACEMDPILAAAARAGVPVVEDAAHALGARYRGRPLGSLGTLGTLSFHETKNVQCGEGGALLINDPSLIERAEILREKGTDRSKFFRGEVDKYSWVDVGSSWVMADLLAAFLHAQLRSVNVIQEQRMHVWTTYHDRLAEWAYTGGVQQPIVPPHCDHPAHLYSLVLPTPDDRNQFIDHLRGRGVHAVFHYLPLHGSPVGQRLAPGTTCPVTDDISGRLVRLPLFAGMAEEELERVIEAVCSFRPASPSA